MARGKAAKEASEAIRVAQLRDLPYSEALHTALGGPYRSVFVRERAFDLSATALADAQRSEIAKLIARDFNVTDRDSLIAHAVRLQALVYSMLLLEKLDIPNMTESEFEGVFDVLNTLTNRVDSIVNAIDDPSYSSYIGTVELKNNPGRYRAAYASTALRKHAR